MIVVVCPSSELESSKTTLDEEGVVLCTLSKGTEDEKVEVDASTSIIPQRSVFLPTGERELLQVRPSWKRGLGGEWDNFP